MEKVNNKGFVLMEVLIVSIFVITILTFTFVQFNVLNRNYNNSFTYNNVNSIYATSNIRDYIYDNGLALSNVFTGATPPTIIDITNCYDASNNYGLQNPDYCNTLFQDANIKQVLFTNEDLTILRSQIKNSSVHDGMIDGKLKEYINYIKDDKDPLYFRLIISFNDGTYASVKV